MEHSVKAEELLRAILKGLGLTAELEVLEKEEPLVFNVTGEDLGLLIGKQGQTLDAIQCLVNAVAARENPSSGQLVVDAEGYRERQKRSVEELALRMAEKAIRERAPVVLRPMGAYERKIVHLVLKDNPQLETVSDGREPYRCVTIYYKELETQE